MEMILRKKVRRLVLTHRDRLLCFGSELIFALCELQNIEVVIINKGEQTTFEEELAKDVIEIITVFSARLYASRSTKTGRFWKRWSVVKQFLSPNPTARTILKAQPFAHWLKQ